MLAKISLTTLVCCCISLQLALGDQMTPKHVLRPFLDFRLTFVSKLKSPPPPFVVAPFPTPDP